MVIHDLDDLGYPDGLETSVYVFVYHCNLHLHNTAVYTPSLLKVSIVIQKNPVVRREPRSLFEKTMGKRTRFV